MPDAVWDDLMAHGNDVSILEHEMNRARQTRHRVMLARAGVSILEHEMNRARRITAFLTFA